MSSCGPRVPTPRHTMANGVLLMLHDSFSRVSLYSGDALAILTDFPDNYVDAVLTDPPYSSGGVTLGAKQADPATKYQLTGTKKQYPAMLGDSKDQRSWTMWCSLWLGQCWRIARDGAPLMVFTDWRQLPALADAMQCAGWRWLGIIPWDKRSARPQIGRFRQQCEFIVYGSKGRLNACTKACLPGLYSYPVVASQKVHLTSKPVALMHDLLAITQPGGTVLDPFMGGGSVGVACAETGRGYLGIELSAEYYNISRDRIAQAG